ncbi:sulfite oxidase heme-binding subunit YedZ [Deinococcus cellulosilyticus]|uniref:Protein-methionine-sulfoxide reductase heme-binding subunit MsrQ n=1 Tax=Deinococcus cellulosilyticus (strain DSM 18568 / NBRC 106333 / KACC 11606 / 5516J-15) TaxID=1223518 RepID=A0A511N7G7_DEIC1|nr:protein-methionine-sulfoxide reductase heme-binding subunit MsrQ [Deinococcus cellulosilyticus]GEM48418.1 protein-methionine-sulfoxide reductase heme-binding subunit MsrQ [Deinococcus cellulosilyticus NBRC 106333 = KACC 11606]
MAPSATIGALLPLPVMVYDAFTGQLGANPLQRAEQQTGLLSLTLILLSLACTPLRLLASRLGTRLLWPARVRKTLGLTGALYALIHLGIYLLDRGPGLLDFLQDALKRPYITVGLTAFLLLIPLVLTSRKDSVRKMGFVRWQRLHRLTYLVGALGVLHYWWSVKEDHTPPLIAAGILLVLFALRFVKKRSR